jgi:DNA-binding NtrC family response regulator
MKKPCGIETAATGIINVLSVSPIEEDHAFLKDSFNNHSEWTLYTKSKWVLYRTLTLSSALNYLQEKRIPVVLCERDLVSSTWKEMLEQLRLFPQPPSLIVTSRLADGYLWAEAINLGVYDVLAKPFDKDEVIRIVSSAWLHWVDQQEIERKRLRDRRAVEQWNAVAG